MNVTRIYAMLIRLYPIEHRESFSAEMQAVFQQGMAARRKDGRVTTIGFVLAELSSLIRGACVEWAARLVYSLYHSNRYIGSSCLPDPRFMRAPGASRDWYAAAQTGQTGSRTAIDESGFCANAHQTFVLASPIRRLSISICRVFLPIHRSSVARTPRSTHPAR